MRKVYPKKFQILCAQLKMDRPNIWGAVGFQRCLLGGFFEFLGPYFCTYFSNPLSNRLDRSKIFAGNIAQQFSSTYIFPSKSYFSRMVLRVWQSRESNLVRQAPNTTLPQKSADCCKAAAAALGRGRCKAIERGYRIIFLPSSFLYLPF